MSIDPSLVDWSTSRSKRNQDSKIIQFMLPTLIANQGQSIRVLCFPAAGWLFEQALIEAFPTTKFTFVGVEQNEKVYTASLAKAKALGSVYNHCTFILNYQGVGELLSGSQVAFDIAYLDYMGTWSREKQGDLRTMFHRDLLTCGGTLVMTLALNRGSLVTNDKLAQAAYLAEIMEQDYMSMVERDVTRCQLAEGSVSHMKISGIPAIVQQMAAMESTILNHAGCTVYDSVSKVGRHHVTPEMSLALYNKGRV